MTQRTRAALCAALAGLVLAAPAVAQADTAPALEGETMRLPWGGRVISDVDASGGRALGIWSNISAQATVSLPAGRELVVRARGDQCEGAPRMTVSIDGLRVLDRSVPERVWTDVRVPIDLAAGRHDVKVAFTNDRLTKACDRNLFVDSLDIAPSVADPFAGAALFVDPDSRARRQVEAWRETRPADAETLETIADASQPTGSAPGTPTCAAPWTSG